MYVTEIRYTHLFESITVLCNKLNDGLRNAVLPGPESK
jgi:hypothetical protein